MGYARLQVLLAPRVRWSQAIAYRYRIPEIMLHSFVEVHLGKHNTEGCGQGIGSAA